MNIDPIQNGVVIDHITAGKGMRLMQLLKLDTTDLSVALLKNVSSHKKGRKDIIKIDADIPVNLDVVAYVDPTATVNIIKGGKLVEKREMELPELLVDVISCKNPRCISSTEQGLEPLFYPVHQVMRHGELVRIPTKYVCAYCDMEQV